jgi:hypothetical protein
MIKVMLLLLFIFVAVAAASKSLTQSGFDYKSSILVHELNLILLTRKVVPDEGIPASSY